MNELEPKKYKSYELRNFLEIEQVQEHLSPQQVWDVQVVSHVFPFKTNNYVVDELIQWEDVPNDPMFVLTFPQRGMLSDEHFQRMSTAMKERPEDAAYLLEVANSIRHELNPHPAGQMEHNVPSIYGEKMMGMQHKYKETVLFFPSQGQTCHAYCTFCFRWPQFVGLDDLKFQSKEVEDLIRYVESNPQITDILFTGGDPMVMSPRIVQNYFQAIVDARKEGRIPNLRTIRIGSKSLTYWPYRYVTDKNVDDLLETFRMVRDAGIHLAFMAHFNHPVELKTEAVQQAIRNLRDAGVTIRSQTPLLRGINTDAAIWAEKWKEEVRLGVIPYYMFVVRDTGAQEFFGVGLAEAHEIYTQAIQRVGGLCRTVRGPSMSCHPGKVEVTGVAEVAGEKVFSLRFLQARDPAWMGQPFFAKYDPDALWLDDLKPAFGSKFFFEDALAKMDEVPMASGQMLEAETT